MNKSYKTQSKCQACTGLNRPHPSSYRGHHTGPERLTEHGGHCSSFVSGAAPPDHPKSRTDEPQAEAPRALPQPACGASPQGPGPSPVCQHPAKHWHQRPPCQAPSTRPYCCFVVRTPCPHSNATPEGRLTAHRRELGTSASCILWMALLYRLSDQALDSPRIAISSLSLPLAHPLASTPPSVARRGYQG